MTVQTQSADGVIHQFPDGTDPGVIDKAMKAYAGQTIPKNQGIRQDLANQADPPIPTSPALASMIASPGGRLLQGVAEPAMTLGQMLAKGASAATSYLGAPQTAQRYIDPVANSLGLGERALERIGAYANQQGQTTPGYKAIAPKTMANADNMMGGGIPGYATNFAAQTLSPVAPGVVGAMGYAGRALANIPNDVMGRRSPVTATDQANAMSDATSRMLSNWQTQNPAASTAAALAPLAAGGVQGMTRLAQTGSLLDTLPSVSMVKALAQKAYKDFDLSGMRVTAESLGGMVDKLKGVLADNGLETDMTPGVLGKLFPKTAAILEHLNDYAQGDRSVQSLDNLKQLINKASNGPVDKSDQRFLRIIGDHLDDFVQGLEGEDLTNPEDFNPAALNSLQTARTLWARSAKAQQLLNMIDKARSNSQWGPLSIGQQLLVQFRKLANNDRGMSRFNPEEQAAIRAVVNGGPVDTALKILGRFSPDSAINLGAAGAGGYLMNIAGGPAGPIGAAALGATGLGAKLLNAHLASRRAINAVSTALGRDSGLPMNAVNTPILPQLGRRLAYPGLVLSSQEQERQRQLRLGQALQDGGQQ